MKKKILFRADGNEKIGLGHLYRVFAIYEMLRDKFDTKILSKSSSYKGIFPTRLSQDFFNNKKKIASSETNYILNKYPPQEYLLILDGYHFDLSYQRKLKKLKYQFIYIDDFAKEYMCADVVINHSLKVKESDFSKEDYTKLFLGADYSMIRPSFLNVSKSEKRIDKLENLLICFGGVDKFDLTLKCLSEVIEIEKIKKINIIVGASYNINKIKSIYNDSKIFIHQNIDEQQMLEVIEDSHFSILPSSTISYEACFVRMPILGGYYVENQKNNYDGLLENNLIIGGGNFLKYQKGDFRKKITSFLRLPEETHEKMMQNQMHFFDGKQKSRFNEIISNL